MQTYFMNSKVAQGLRFIQSNGMRKLIKVITKAYKY